MASPLWGPNAPMAGPKSGREKAEGERGKR